MKNYFFIIMLGYTSVFSDIVHSNDYYDQEYYSYIWGTYNADSLVANIIALYGTVLVAIAIAPVIGIGALAGCCLCSGSLHVRALKGAAIPGVLAALVASALEADMWYRWRMGEFSGDSLP
ncbi:hypothetical protein [Endozoicomonas sp. ONNA2]|uniref:hypothetical protein n=1 Tax=Endozoicomonas sp. ONNA2 TaxID=2828741 RepID=UPI002147B853|nr:hypothetical protein [Endozoicomonas sp. ONNA2]